MLNLIPSFFRTLTLLELYQNITMQKPLRNKYVYSTYLLPLLLFFLSSLIDTFFLYLLPVVSIPLFTFYSYLVYKNKLDVSLVITAISHVIYYVLYNIFSLLIILLHIPCYFFNIKISYLFILFTSGLLTLLATHCLFKNKRIKSGISIITTKPLIRYGVLFSIVILVIKTLDNIYLSSYKYVMPLPLATILLALLLFTWWQKQITKSYIEKLRKLEVQSLYDELEEKERQIQKLVADNESLSRIIHKDNKLIPAMENAVINFLSTEDFHNPDKLKQYGLELTQKLQDMTQDRRGILNSYDSECHNLRLTGHVSLDAILVYMQKKADANHIIFECKHTPETIDYLLTKISEDDLTHLLSDLMENAIISMRKQGNGRLQITFGKLQKEAYISIADSGIPFDIATLHSFGLQPHTTHKDSGGSGIGLMDIWKIKRKYRATIQIQEYEKHSTNFTKRILFSFNAKNHYVIQSFRHAEISNTQTRGDLYIIPAETKEKNEGKKHERNTENLNS